MNTVNIALRVKAKNGVLQRFLDEKGWTQADFAREIGVRQSTVGKWFNMDDHPKSEQMLFKIAELVGKHPEQIFPECLTVIEKQKKGGWNFDITLYKDIDVATLPFHEAKALPAPPAHKSTEQFQRTVDEVLTTLTPREEWIIRARFGLDGEIKTLAEIAKELGTGPERIRQIEAKALKKLRHPTRKEKLKDLLEEAV